MYPKMFAFRVIEGKTRGNLVKIAIFASSSMLIKILKSLRPLEAKGQLRHWVNMGVALLVFLHGKKMSSVGNRLYLVPLGRSVQSFVSI